MPTNNLVVENYPSGLLWRLRHHEQENTVGPEAVIRAQICRGPGDKKMVGQKTRRKVGGCRSYLDRAQIGRGRR